MDNYHLSIRTVSSIDKACNAMGFLRDFFRYIDGIFFCKDLGRHLFRFAAAEEQKNND